MKKAVELVAIDKCKATTEEEVFDAVRKIVVVLVAREWQKKNS